MKAELLTTFEKWANWKSILALLGLQMLFNLVIMPGISSSNAHDLPVLDLQFWYTPQRAYEIIGTYPPELLRSAAIGRLTVDMVYPLIYGFMIYFMLTVTFRRAFPKNIFSNWIIFIPWGGVLFDYLENISLSIIYLRYPLELTTLAWIASIFTAIKWILIGIGFFLVLIGGIKLLFQRL